MAATAFRPFSDQILISQYSVNHNDVGTETYSLSMSLPSFFGLVFFLFFSPSWLWFAIFTGVCASNERLWKKMKQTWLSCSEHVSDAVAKGKRQDDGREAKEKTQADAEATATAKAEGLEQEHVNDDLLPPHHFTIPDVTPVPIPSITVNDESSQIRDS